MTHRRGLIARLGLGAGAFLLAPIARRLVGEARGAAPAGHRALFCLVGGGIHWDWCFAPTEYRARDEGDPGDAVPPTTRFTWPPMLARLERHRARLLLVDGLGNRPRTGEHTHSAGYAALSCVPSPGGLNNEWGPPGGITLDQCVAGRIGGDTRFRSVLFGVNADEARPQATSVFARGRGQPADVGRLRGALAGEERGKLDRYLAAIEDYDRRFTASAGRRCVAPSRPDAVETPEERLTLMNEMTAVALACGLTNVVGVAVGTGYSHRTMPLFPRLSEGLDQPIDGAIGHAGEKAHAAAMNRLHDFNAGLMARLLEVLSTIPEGEGTAADSLVGLYTSDNGEMHHSRKDRWPVVVLGDLRGRRLRTGGRFVRLTPGERPLADLYAAVATGAGAPLDRFGENEQPRGPLELLSP